MITQSLFHFYSLSMTETIYIFFLKKYVSKKVVSLPKIKSQSFSLNQVNVFIAGVPVYQQHKLCGGTSIIIISWPVVSQGLSTNGQLYHSITPRTHWPYNLVICIYTNYTYTLYGNHYKGIKKSQLIPKYLYRWIGEKNCVQILFQAENINFFFSITHSHILMFRFYTRKEMLVILLSLFCFECFETFDNV